MMRVDTDDLRAKATQIEELNLVAPMLGGTAPSAPDALTLSRSAVANLQENVAFLVQNQVCGSHEGDRLAETLRSVATAYDDVDAAARADIDGIGPPMEPVVPAANTIAPPVLPAPLGNRGPVSADEIGDVEKAQAMLSSGDHGTTLRSAAAEWSANAAMLRSSAETFNVRIPAWEGDAADQAYQKFATFGEWLADLGDAWDRLAGEAFRIADAHVKALLDHTPVYQQYQQLKSQMIAAIQNGGGAAHYLGGQMEQLHRRSESILDGYAGEAAPRSVSPTNPLPSSGVPTIPVTPNHASRQSDSPGASAGGGGGGGTTTASPTRQASPTSAQSGPGESSPPAGAEQGAGGGSPSGGGAPAGGAPSRSAPSLPGDDSQELPTLPDDPGLHPAAADTGGGASGGGIGGGGIPATPLQPSVGGVAVGPGPVGGPVGAAGAPVAAGSSGGMMGGGVPMAGHGQAPGGKEKRRTPGLAPDEDLYVEDRAHTEEVIGARKRRTVQDPKESP